MTLYHGIIVGSWVVLACYWFVAALFAKRVVERQSRASRLIQLAVMVAAFELLLNPDLPLYRAGHFVVPHTPLVGLAGTMICLAGLAFTFWARYTLGGNWSGTVTFKEDHELVLRGPYQFVRHPIYTGLLTMFLGSAVVWSTWPAFAGLAIEFLGLWLKSKREEALMMKHFPDTYPLYKARVKGIVPYVF